MAPAKQMPLPRQYWWDTDPAPRPRDYVAPLPR